MSTKLCNGPRCCSVVGKPSDGRTKSGRSLISRPCARTIVRRRRRTPKLQTAAKRRKLTQCYSSSSGAAGCQNNGTGPRPTNTFTQTKKDLMSRRRSIGRASKLAQSQHLPQLAYPTTKTHCTKVYCAYFATLRQTGLPWLLHLLSHAALCMRSPWCLQVQYFLLLQQSLQLRWPMS